MKKQLLVLISILAVVCAPPSTLYAKSKSVLTNWDVVRSLSAGTKVRIDLKAGGHVEGTVNQVSENDLSLDRGGAARSYNRAEIRKIFRLESGSRGKSILIGAAVGAGGGAGSGAIALGATGGSDQTGKVMGVFTLAGAGIGALVGSVVGRGTKKTLVYESN
jgi:hypothetical protein